MKFTIDWLKDYLDTQISADEIAIRLTGLGLEVDDVIKEIVPIAAKIIECDDIPGTHLHKLVVDDGSGTPRQVVCGAPNARVGLVSALALPGCKIGDMEIKSGKIRGIESYGMMCSERELGLGDDHSGIIELDENSKLGKSEIIFEAGITPNRPDYLSVLGIARDLAAANIGKFKVQSSKFKVQTSDNKKATIENNDACPVYFLCEINNIKMAKSKDVISRRLSAIGINTKNAAIDATNYICYDIGQPMHCFDADEIKGDIVVRNAGPGEKFTDLFGVEHELIESDLVIADADGILALAGVIGGMRGSTADTTKNILVESAYFNPISVRKTAKRIGVSTDSSYRFERGIDPTIGMDAINRAVDIITNACGGEIIGVYQAGEVPVESRKIKYYPEFFKKITGLELNADAQIEILKKLGFNINTSGNEWIVIPTPARVDIQIAENIVSELIRIYGYDKFESESEKPVADAFPKIYGLKARLCARGLNESITYGFGDSEKEQMISDKKSVMVKNPIVSNFDTARNGLIQNMLDIIAANDRFRRSNLSLFEFGTVFDGDVPGAQHNQLVIARTGINGDNMGAKHGPNVEIYDVRDDLLSLFPDAIVEGVADEKWMNPYRAGQLVLGGKVIAKFAELHPVIAKKFGIKTRVVLGIVDNFNFEFADEIVDFKAAQPINDFPEFPLITRDFAFIVDNKVLPGDIISAIKSENPIIYETNVFDVFDMGGGKKSVAFELVLQPESNMTDADLMNLQNKIIEEIESKFNAKIRDKK